MLVAIASAAGGAAACIAAGRILARRPAGLFRVDASDGGSLRADPFARAAVRLRERAASGRRARARRTNEIERHIPELAETLAMGLRAGLSIDRAFSLYCTRFDDELARACARAFGSWSSGLVTRDEALSAMAGEFDSTMLERLVAGVSRTARFGGSLARSLELLAAEARSRRKASIEERIAKVPVKMMVPTAVLILPAMLIVVMGPVLLGALS